MASPPRTSSATETRREGSARGRRGSATRGRREDARWEESAQDIHPRGPAEWRVDAVP